MQQQQQPLQPLASTLHYQQQQDEIRTQHSIQIQTHDFQQNHITGNDQYIQLYTPTYLEATPKTVLRARQASNSEPLSNTTPSSSRTSPAAESGSPAKQAPCHREKNRLAASKCREKSKKFIDDLRIREQELRARNAKLTAEAAMVKKEVLELKHELLCHGNCRCEIIQEYLASAAKNINRMSGGNVGGGSLNYTALESSTVNK